MTGAIVKGFFKFYPGIFHKKRSFSGENRFLGWGIVFENQRGGRSVRKSQRGDRSPQVPPFYSPMGSGDTPETPRTEL